MFQTAPSLIIRHHLYIHTHLLYDRSITMSVIELANIEDHRNRMKNKHIRTILHVHFYIFSLAGVA